MDDPSPRPSEHHHQCHPMPRHSLFTQSAWLRAIAALMIIAVLFVCVQWAIQS